MSKKTVKDLRPLEGTHVFVRVDYNVPLEGGRITDETRIRASLPTLEHLIKGGARLALASHLGRPKKGPAPELSLRPVAARLSELLHRVGDIEVEVLLFDQLEDRALEFIGSLVPGPSLAVAVPDEPALVEIAVSLLVAEALLVGEGNPIHRATLYKRR